MRRSDYDVIYAARTEPRGFMWGFLTCNAMWGLLLVSGLAACTRTFVPSGRPGCPNATVWSDSAQRCIAREGR